VTRDQAMASVNAFLALGRWRVMRIMGVGTGGRLVLQGLGKFKGVEKRKWVGFRMGEP
jgi:hypothetical protein